MRRRRLCDVEKAAGCGKRRPPADLRWLFSQVTIATTEGGTGGNHDPRQLFHLLPGGPGGVSLLERQTYRQWRSLTDLQKVSHPRRLRKRTIIIQPFTSPSLPEYPFRAVDTRVLTHLQHFCSAFFPGMDIELGPATDLSSVPHLTSRVHKDTQRTQVLVGDLIRFLESRRPRHAQCVMGVTTVDLYPSPEWNFVMGHASLTSGCGVISFGRYFNSQFADSAPTLPQQLNHLWVLARVVSHELCHTLGMKHCYYFSCAMNESSSIEEAAMQPLFLCPVCLRKLKKRLRFDIFQRYNLLREALCGLMGVICEGEREGSRKVDVSAASEQAAIFQKEGDRENSGGVWLNQPSPLKTGEASDSELLQQTLTVVTKAQNTSLMEGASPCVITDQGEDTSHTSMGGGHNQSSAVHLVHGNDQSGVHTSGSSGEAPNNYSTQLLHALEWLERVRESCALPDGKT